MRLALIRKLNCVRCGKAPPSQAAHSNFYMHGKAKGKKADDRYTVPLCHTCHQWFDQYQQLNREQSKEQFRQWLQIADFWLQDDSLLYPF